MKIKSLLREITPPAIWQLLRNLNTYGSVKPVRYRGVFKNSTDIPQENQWESDLWVEQQEAVLTDVANRKPSFFPTLGGPRELTALYLNLLTSKDKISVLDFGGASGTTYLEMARSGALLFPDKISWTVVDNPTTRELGEKVKNEKDQLFFLSEVPSNQEFDVLHISAVLQYIDDIPALMDMLIKKANSSHIILTRLFGGEDNLEGFIENKAFGRRCPVHVFNARKLADQIEAHGFRALYRGVNKEESVLPSAYQDIPPEYQITNSTHLIFEKK